MLSSFTRLQTNDRTFSQLQDNIGNSINPILLNKVLNGVILQGVVLASGTNTINHTLGRPLIGWFPVRIRQSVTLYDTQDTNPLPAKTLLLNASATGSVDLYVF